MNGKKDTYYINKTLNGDDKAFSCLIEKYQDFLYHLALKIVKNTEDAEEVAQDAFLKAYRNLGSFRQESKFSSWLYKITYHTAISKTRLKFNQMHSLPVDEGNYSDDQFDFSDSLKELKLSEQKKYINMAMNSLPEQMQIVLTLRYLEECSLKEIENITSIGISNIKTLLHRGRKKLLTSMTELLKNEIKSII